MMRKVGKEKSKGQKNGKKFVDNIKNWKGVQFGQLSFQNNGQNDLEFHCNQLSQPKRHKMMMMFSGEFCYI